MNEYHFPVAGQTTNALKTDAVIMEMWIIFKLTFRTRAASQNETVPFVLAYRVRLFFEINDSTTFYLAWLYQAPVMYMGIWHTAAIGLLFSLVLHVCGQLSVLTFKIKNLNLDDREIDSETTRSIFRDIVVRHREILECVLTFLHLLINPLCSWSHVSFLNIQISDGYQRCIWINPRGRTRPVYGSHRSYLLCCFSGE